MIAGVAADTDNTFGASAEELAAAALQDTGILTPATTINGKSAAELLEALAGKVQEYEEATRLGSLLVRRGVLSEEELEKALDLQRSGNSLRLGEALVELNICSEEDIRRNVEAQGMIRESLSDLDEFRRKIDSIKERLRLYL